MNNIYNDYTNEAMMFEACDEDDFLPFIDVASDDDYLLANNTIDTISNFENSEGYKCSSVRIHVERAIRQLKYFKF